MLTRTTIGLILLFIFPFQSAIACSSYDAVYKPREPLSDGTAYELRIVPTKDLNSPYSTHVIVQATKKNASDTALFQINMDYTCGGGSAPTCTLSAKTTRGRKLEIIPAALDESFAPRFFISREPQTAPYALILPNAPTEFHYKASDLSKEHITYFDPKTPPPYDFPSVWMLSGCQK